jgi:hypothetical protein
MIGCPERKNDGDEQRNLAPLIGVDEAGPSRTRVQAHSAVQWLARAARAYIPVRPNDGHTNLGWTHLDLGAKNMMRGCKVSLTRVMDAMEVPDTRVIPAWRRGSGLVAGGALARRSGSATFNPGAKR